jgi:multidrug efflux pump subunit AcrA (membrane-fusion protein)
LKQAAVEAARANLQRLEDLKNFDRVTAPFDGTVTLRNTDIGR